MEAIDDYANENIVRSLAYTALEERQAHNYAGLIPIASKLLRTRMTVLGTADPKSRDWDTVVQWQDDTCPNMIESLWASGGSVADEIYQKPVYFKRLDADTLHAMIEFAELDTHHFVVVLILEEGSGEISDIKYHNTKELTEEEWLDVFENWSRTVEDAERVFLTKVTRHKRIFTAGDQTPSTPDSVRAKDAPEDYWGDWSSDEGSSRDHKDNRPHPLRADLKESEDSDDEYYARWSKDPGTLTPGLEDERPGRILQPASALREEDRNQDELDEEYDQSYNPLFTVPSVPNLMDAHTAALSELTHMLQNTLPGAQSLRNNRVQAINPLPKAVSRLRTNNPNNNQSTSSSEEMLTNENNLIPGAYPESGTQSPVHKLAATEEEQAMGKGLFMKSLSALIGAARLLGYEGKDILEMVQEIVNHP
ncbi:hypothetical protein MFLAVUS_003380 [Mucor flavus]|uniref:Uncharacterized protein n=1 Tax=Mucor flavus TaxID=439312 RepID=A0ABP9YSX9_9FUNG